MVGPDIVRLPDGQRYTVKPVFAGLQFQSQELNETSHAFPIGWTIVLRTEDEVSDRESTSTGESTKKMHSFREPTLQSDCLFISSISNPSNDEYKPAASPTRQIAMILWITLYWYFHQHEPKDHLLTEASKHTPDVGKPRGEWLINIRRDGVLRGRNLIPKLERMGLIMSYNSAVGSGAEDDGWDEMFVSRRMFWQISGRLFLFTLAPNKPSSFPGSPVTSRPTSPVGNHKLSVSPHARHLRADSDLPGGALPLLSQPPSFPIGPFYSSSHLPTYYPPMPPVYTTTDNIRHPVRPKPPRMGEVFYTRFVPRMNQYLSFRVASSSPKPVPYWGPVGPSPPQQAAELLKLSDAELLQKWLASKRVKTFWGDYQPDFLTNAFSLKHSFPAIGLWDGVPFGYFEIYWVREDILGKTIGAGEQNDWDRGLHVLVGEEWGRGRVPYWLSSLVHWCLTVDYRTMTVCSEPRIDNQRFVQLLQNEGFAKEKQVTFPHKQSWFMKLRRDAWEGPKI